jgi:hypothetical protein
MAALLDAMERTGLALQVIIEHGEHIYLLRDINEPATAPVEAYARSLPSLLGLIR